jgi:hypothetical protein
MDLSEAKLLTGQRLNPAYPIDDGFGGEQVTDVLRNEKGAIQALLPRDSSPFSVRTSWANTAPIPATRAIDCLSTVFTGESNPSDERSC